jgi:[NiFe] hydrogenase diaphorase moiety large subunit
MSKEEVKAIKQTCKSVGNGDQSRLMDVLISVQRQFGGISDEATDIIARELALPRVEVESLVSFYAFFSEQPSGKVVIRLCNDIIDRMHGAELVAEAFQEELGIGFGETTSDGQITLTSTACMGMSDQAPAALINEVVYTRLSSDQARQIAAQLKIDPNPKKLVKELGDGNNAHDLVAVMIENNIRKAGPVVLSEMEPGAGLEKALAMSPTEVIRNVKTARLRGRGGAGFPTGMKWEYTRATPADRRFIVCNADEGEPGTFKDRVILTEHPDLMFEGMTIAGYAIGSAEGIVYLRGEYAYLRAFLESVLQRRRDDGLLGKNILGKEGFNFDIRIQLGAGAYICGEETALLSSCEGLRGDPKNRPPFPAQRGYLGYPTSVNNVETLCCVARIMEHGSAWFSTLGSDRSAGTKLLSVSGDCRRPGVYELPLGIPLAEVLRLAGAEDAKFVQVGGPSGQMASREDFKRCICFDDLSTGGSIMVFGENRDPLEVVEAFLEFFADESCGYCTPCRVGTTLLHNKIKSLREGKCTPDDLVYLKDLAETVKQMSRCGLGQTAGNPVLTTFDKFRSDYESLVQDRIEGRQPQFDISEATLEASSIVGRESVVTHE